MASWCDGRNGRHLSLQVPPEIKSMLIKRKSHTGQCMSFQICEALKARWDRLGLPSVAPPEQVVPRTGINPVAATGLIVPGAPTARTDRSSESLSPPVTLDGLFQGQ